jgi:hypothetical protein
MDLKRKTQLRNLLTAYRNDVCEEASELAEIRLTTKCTQCDYYDCDRGCTIDNNLLTLENELWEAR